ncbi:scarecrow-like protein 13 [Silene latifolia]|uniref:scarecrow-like protein 13 n=1 Tax=Silene latifolia TaxID=37657 RepID=UPI003D785B85
MQTSTIHHSTGGVHGLFYQHAQDMTPYFPYNNMQLDSASIATQMSSQAYNEGYVTLDSTPPTSMYNVYDSPSDVTSSFKKNQFSPQESQSYISDPHHSPDNNFGSPASGSSVVDDNSELRNWLRDVERSLLGPDSCLTDHHYCTLTHKGDLEASSTLKQVMEIVPRMDLKQVLCLSAQAVADKDLVVAPSLLDEVGKRVSVCGTPIERLAAYMMEGLKARLEVSGFNIYKKLKCQQPTSSQLLSYMHVLYEYCPYFQFAYTSANLIIQEATQNESSIHIIDFQIGMGTQWVLLFESLAKRPGGPPFVRITGVDDSHSAYARGGGLEVVAYRLSKSAESYGVPFEFHAAAMSGCKVERENLGVLPGEALAVNFPFMLHHMPDESVNTINHRDRLLRLVKSLSPRVVTLVEQESNTNTPPFMHRFLETLDYYTAMFESIDVALPRNDKRRIHAEQHCVARDIVNMIACEDEERMERHEPFGKWRARFSMAGFNQLPLSMNVKNGTRGLLNKFDKNYRLEEGLGALYLGWKNRGMATSSAWK